MLLSEPRDSLLKFEISFARLSFWYTGFPGTPAVLANGVYIIILLNICWPVEDAQIRD